MSMSLDLTSLEHAIAQVDEALAFARSELAQQNDRIAFQFRASSIQAFEYTYELAIKMLIRFLEITEPQESSLSTMSFQNIIRLGYERGLLQSELRVWLAFRKSRGTTSHTYNGDKAQEVFNCIPAFIAEAKFLLNTIQQRQMPNDA